MKDSDEDRSKRFIEDEDGAFVFVDKNKDKDVNYTKLTILKVNNTSAAGTKYFIDESATDMINLKYLALFTRKNIHPDDIIL